MCKRRGRSNFPVLKIRSTGNDHEQLDGQDRFDMICYKESELTVKRTKNEVMIMRYSLQMLTPQHKPVISDDVLLTLCVLCFLPF